MSSVRITDRVAVEAFAVAVQVVDELAGVFTPDGLSEADVDRLLEDVDFGRAVRPRSSAVTGLGVSL